MTKAKSSVSSQRAAGVEVAQQRLLLLKGGEFVHDEQRVLSTPGLAVVLTQ